MMVKTNFTQVILGIFLRNMALDGAIFAAIAAFGYLQNWFTEPIQYYWLGNACLLAGLCLLLLAGISTLLQRMDLAGQDAYQGPAAFSDFGTIGSGDGPGRIPVVSSDEGRSNFWQQYAASLSLALAGIDVLAVGIALRVIGQ